MRVRRLRPGLRAARRPVAEVVADAERRGAAVHLVRSPAGKSALLAELAGALGFPAWVGRNWDALADALRDLSWAEPGPHAVVWTGPEVLRAAEPAAYRTAIEVLREAADASASTARPLTVLLVAERTAD